MQDFVDAHRKAKGLVRAAEQEEEQQKMANGLHEMMQEMRQKMQNSITIVPTPVPNDGSAVAAVEAKGDGDGTSRSKSNGDTDEAEVCAGKLLEDGLKVDKVSTVQAGSSKLSSCARGNPGDLILVQNALRLPSFCLVAMRFNQYQFKQFPYTL